MVQRSIRIEKIFRNVHAAKRLFVDVNRSFDRGSGISIGQTSTLMFLHRSGRRTIGEITAALGVSKGATTQLLEGLIERQLVRRHQDDQDRRVVYIELSDEGMNHLRQLHQGGIEQVVRLFEQLDDDELAHIEAITEKLLTKAKEIRHDAIA